MTTEAIWSIITKGTVTSLNLIQQWLHDHSKTCFSKLTLNMAAPVSQRSNNVKPVPLLWMYLTVPVHWLEYPIIRRPETLIPWLYLQLTFWKSVDTKLHTPWIDRSTQTRIQTAFRTRKLCILEFCYKSTVWIHQLQKCSNDSAPSSFLWRLLNYNQN